MCSGGGYSGPSAAEIAAQEQAALSKAQAETARINAEKDKAKQAQDAQIAAEQADIANQDAARRTKNRTLLAGLEAEEGTTLEDPTSKSTKKAKRANTLIQGVA